MRPASSRAVLVPGAVGDAGGLDDGGVVAHVVDDADEAVVEDGDRLAEAGLEAGGDRAAGGAFGEGGGDLGLLFQRQRHMGSLVIRSPGGIGR